MLPSRRKSVLVTQDCPRPRYPTFEPGVGAGEGMFGLGDLILRGREREKYGMVIMSLVERRREGRWGRETVMDASIQGCGPRTARIHRLIPKRFETREICARIIPRRLSALITEIRTGVVGSENMQDVDATRHALHRHLVLSLTVRRSGMQSMAVWTSRHFKPTFVFGRGPYLDDSELGDGKVDTSEASTCHEASGADVNNYLESLPGSVVCRPGYPTEEATDSREKFHLCSTDERETTQLTANSPPSPPPKHNLAIKNMKR